MVDDEESNIDIIVEAIGDEYSISVALDGNGALEYLQSVLPDLILLDVVMPGMDGFEVYTRLQADERTRSIPVVFLSAQANAQSREKARRLGAVDFVPKPIDPDHLKEAVKRALSTAD